MIFISASAMVTGAGCALLGKIRTPQFFSRSGRIRVQALLSAYGSPITGIGINPHEDAKK
jgi:hypothetical protein